MARRRSQSDSPPPRQASAEPSLVELLLAAGWLITGAIQYLGAHQRMLILTGKEPWLEELALLDLTAVYVLLLAGTLVCFVLRIMRSGRVSSKKK